MGPDNTLSAHPSRGQLRAFNLGQLDDDQTLVIGTHLEECPACCRLLRDLPAEDRFVGQVRAAADSTGPGRVRPNLAHCPERLGDYHLLREVGRGGMGVVYEAEQRSLGRRVALKVLPIRALTETAAVERFRREARLAARLHHSNIVPVFEVGQDGDACFYAMQFIPGHSLDRVLAQLREPGPAGTPGPITRLLCPNPGTSPPSAGAAPGRGREGRPPRLDYSAVARVGLEAAQALAYAHQRGVLHRDIKPSNLLLDESGTVWVTDFGLAKAEEDGLTRSSDMLGTLRYMAPERFGGACDTRADIYGLGLTLYELLTLRPAFPGTDQARLMDQIRHEDPARPRALDPGVPRDLETVVLKAMDKDPARRYQTAAELADDLQRFLGDEPVRARRPTPPERLWRWCRGHPGMAALSAALLLTLLAGLAGVTLKWREAEAEHVQADLARRTAEEQSRRYQGLSAQFMLERGSNLCEQGRYGHGLLWLARGLEVAPADSPLQQSLRSALGGWGAQLHPLRAILPQGSTIHAAALSPDGKTVLLGSSDGTARLWQLDEVAADGAAPSWGRPLGAPLRFGEAVAAVAFSPDGRAAVAASEDGTARLLSAGTGEPLGEPLRHDLPMRVAVFAPDGRVVATGSNDGTARLWDVPTGRPHGEPLRHAASIRSAAFSPDGERLVTGSDDQTARIWNTATCRPVADPLRHQGSVRAVAFSPDGRTVLTGSNDTTACLWDTASGRRLGDPLHFDRPVATTVFSPDGTRFLAAPEDKVAEVRDTRTGRPVGQPLHHLDRIFGAAFSPDGTMLVTGSDDGTARVWDAATGQPLGEPLRHGNGVHVVAFGPDGREVLVAEWGGLARVWGVSRADAGARLLAREPKRVVGVTFSPDGRSIWEATGKLRRLDVTTGRCLQELKVRGEVLFSAACSPDGRTLAAASLSGAARLWDVASGEPRGEPLRHPAPAWVMAVAINPDGRTLATGGGDFESSKRRGEGMLWEVAGGRPLARLQGHDREVIAVAFSPDGRTLATGSRDNSARLWEAGTGRPGPVLAHRDWVTAVAFSPDGRRVLTASRDGTAHLWDAATGQSAAPALRHEAAVLGAAFSPDGRLILTGCEDGTAHLWESVTGQPAAAPFRQGALVHAVAFSPDGRWLVTGGEDGATRLLPVPPVQAGGVEAVRLGIEVAAAMELQPSGDLAYLQGDVWRQRLRQLTELHGRAVPEWVAAPDLPPGRAAAP
jgi:WD40 repeat protein/serine/threonine protein kinase